MGVRLPLSERISRMIINHPKKLLIAGLLIVGALLPGLKYLGADFSYRIWFRTTDPMIVKFDNFEKQFGNDEVIVVLVHNESGLFNPQSIELLKSLTDRLWQVEDVIRVDSLTNYQWTSATDEDISIDDFISSQPNAEELILKKAQALGDETLPYYLISIDAKIAMVFAKIRPFPGGAPDDQRLIADTRKIISDLSDGKHTFYINGSTAINNTFREASAHDLSTMMPIVLTLIVLFLIAYFRKMTGILFPFIVIFATLFATFGFSGLIGIKFNNIITMIPTIIIAIAIADTVHVLVTYFQFRRAGYDRREATYKSYLKNISPTFLTSVSTAIGFLSFSTADLVPLAHLGGLASFGTMLAWLLTLILIGPLLVLIPVKVKTYRNNDNSAQGQTIEKAETSYLADKIAQLTMKWVARNRYLIVVSITICFAASVYVALQNEVNSNPYEYFDKSVPLRQANDFGLEKMGGVNGPEIVVSSGKSEGIKEPTFLKKVEQFENWLESQEYITRVNSVVDIIKSMNRSFNGDRQEFYKLPETQGEIAELLFMYTMSLPQGMDINDRVTINYDSLRLTALWSSQDSLSSLQRIKEIENKAKELNLNAYVTGKMPIYQGMNNLVVDTFFTSIGLALVGISLLLILVFKSIKLGLFSMIPNVIPLGFGAAAMTLLNRPIDIGTALVTSVCLGIVVDDTIHFLSNYNRLVTEGKSTLSALRYVLGHTGPALCVTTLVLVAGFGVMAFAEFIPNVNFGVLSALVLTIALLVDLVFLPALLLVVEDMKKPKRSKDILKSGFSSHY